MCGWRDIDSDSDSVADLLTLMMVGQVVNTSAASSVFIPSSLTDDYQLRLQLFSRASQLPTSLFCLSLPLTLTEVIGMIVTEY